MSAIIYINTEDQDELYTSTCKLARFLGLNVSGNINLNSGVMSLCGTSSVDLSPGAWNAQVGYKEVTVKEFLTRLVAAGKEVPIKPKTVVVPLNDEYKAIVRKDTVEVGCQTFPYSKIEEIIAAHKELQQ